MTNVGLLFCAREEYIPGGFTLDSIGSLAVAGAVDESEKLVVVLFSRRELADLRFQVRT